VGGVLPSAFNPPTGTLPPGLSFDTGTGMLSGTPTTAGAAARTADVRLTVSSRNLPPTASPDGLLFLALPDKPVQP
jgi:hypothetical protein